MRREKLDALANITTLLDGIVVRRTWTDRVHVLVKREVEVGALLRVGVVFVSYFLNLLLQLLRDFELPVAHFVYLQTRSFRAIVASSLHDLHV